MSEPTRIEGADLFAGLWDRVREWQQAQPWFALKHSTIPAERELGEAMFQDAVTEQQRVADQAGKAAMAARGQKDADARAEQLGVGTILADRVRAMQPGKEPGEVAKAKAWWLRAKTPVLVLAGEEKAAELVAAWLVTRAQGRFVLANELQRRRFEDAWIQSLLETRLLAIVGLFVDGDEKTFFGSLLHELLDVRERAGKRTVLASALDKTGLIGAVSDAVRRRIAGEDAAWIAVGGAR